MKRLLLMLTFTTIKIYSACCQDWITILIHGTVGLRANFNLNTFIHLLKDDIDYTQYKRNVYNMREHPYLYTSQSMQDLGLNKVDPYISCPSGAYVFSLLYKELEKNYFSNVRKNCFYTFGWSGLLSYKQRYKESQTLYDELKNKLCYFKKMGKTPKVRIIAYSHGGNLALNLAAIREEMHPQDTFKIDELVVLGMPVQQATSCLIYSNIFKKIYHIYSPGDSVQRLDIFSPCNLISHKKFTGYLPTTLTQIEIKVIGKLLSHPEIALPQGLKGVIDQSPGHIEFWSFGWSQSGYRRNFVMFPLPVAVYVPYFIWASNRLCDLSSNDRHVCLEIWPDKERTIVINKKIKSMRKNINFNYSLLENLKNKCKCFHPDDSNYRDGYLKLKHSIDTKICR